MTREEAKVFGYGFTDNSDNIRDQYVILVHEVDEIIDRIYDDIDSRICENCEYYTGYSCGESAFEFPCESSFGCNKFVRRLESK